MVGTEEDTDQLALVRAVIEYIQSLQNQLNQDKENSLPEGFEEMFTRMSEETKSVV